MVLNPTWSGRYTNLGKGLAVTPQEKAQTRRDARVGEKRLSNVLTPVEEEGPFPLAQDATAATSTVQVAPATQPLRGPAEEQAMPDVGKWISTATGQDTLYGGGEYAPRSGNKRPKKKSIKKTPTKSIKKGKKKLSRKKSPKKLSRKKLSKRGSKKKFLKKGSRKKTLRKKTLRKKSKRKSKK